MNEKERGPMENTCVGTDTEIRILLFPEGKQIRFAFSQALLYVFTHESLCDYNWFHFTVMNEAGMEGSWPGRKAN